MTQCTLKIVNEKGLHARASAKLVEVVEAARGEGIRGLIRAVLSAYGATLVLLAGLVLLTLRRGRRARAELKSIEDRSKRNG